MYPLRVRTTRFCFCRAQFDRMPSRPAVWLECDEVLLPQFRHNLLRCLQRCLRADARVDLAARPAGEVGQRAFEQLARRLASSIGVLPSRSNGEITITMYTGTSMLLARPETSAGVIRLALSAPSVSATTARRVPPRSASSRPVSAIASNSDVAPKGRLIASNCCRMLPGAGASGCSARNCLSKTNRPA